MFVYFFLTFYEQGNILYAPIIFLMLDLVKPNVYLNYIHSIYITDLLHIKVLKSVRSVNQWYIRKDLIIVKVKYTIETFHLNTPL